MTGSEPSSPKKESITLTPDFLKDLTATITQVILQTHLQKPTFASTSKPASEELNQSPAIKYDGRNFWLWSQMVEVYLSSKKKIGFINGTGERPNKDEPGYDTWKCDDDAVRNWLLNSLEPVQLGNFVRLPTSKDIWDAIKVSSFDGSDSTQIYNFQLRVWGLKQAGGSLEDYYNNLQALWREIDFRTPNNMKCKEDADEFNKITQRDRLHVFLGGLDNRLDSIRAEILRMRPLPVVEEAFSHVRREDVRQAVHGGDSHNSMAMLTVGNKTNVVSYNTTQSNVFGSGPSAGGVSMLGQLPTPDLKQQVADIHYSTPQAGVQPSAGTDTEKASAAVARGRSKKDLACHHCKVKGHTKKECFILHGYPDWWDDYQKRKQSDGKARATLVKTNGKEISEEGTISSLYNSFSKNGTWVIDSGATDHMTYSRRDVTSVSKARKSEILNANGVSYPVVGAGDVELTKNLKLSNTLIVP